MRRAGTITRSHSFASGSCTQDGQLLEVTLHPDGTATATLVQTFPGGGGFSEHADGTYTMEGCGTPSDDFVVELTGRHDPPDADQPGWVELNRPDGERILEGIYDTENMQLSYRLDTLYEQFKDRVTNPRTYLDYGFPSLTQTTES